MILTKTLHHLFAYPEPAFVWDQYSSIQEHCRQKTKAVLLSCISFCNKIRQFLLSVTPDKGLCISATTRPSAPSRGGTHCNIPNRAGIRLQPYFQQISLELNHHCQVPKRTYHRLSGLSNMQPESWAELLNCKSYWVASYSP